MLGKLRTRTGRKPCWRGGYCLPVGAAQALFEAIGSRIERPYHAEYDRVLAAVREQMGEADFKAAWAAGARMTVDQAIASLGRTLASRQPVVAPIAHDHPAGLSEREVEVLRLVA